MYLLFVMSFLSVFKYSDGVVYYITSGSIINETCATSANTSVWPCYSFEHFLHNKDLVIYKNSITLYLLTGAFNLEGNHSLQLSDKDKVEIISLTNQSVSFTCHQKVRIIFHNIQKLVISSLKFNLCKIQVFNSIINISTQVSITKSVFSMSMDYAVTFVRKRGKHIKWKILVCDCYFLENNGAMSLNFGTEKYSSINTVINICNTTFSNNLRTGDGGTLHMNKAHLKLFGSTFVNNSVSQYGGAIQIIHSSVIIKDINFTENSASQSGGAIYVWFSNMKVNNCLFACNLAEVHGGAIKSEDTKNIEIYSSVFSDNTATISGGAIYTSYVFMVECLLENNYAGYSGGAINLIEDPYPIVITEDSEILKTTFVSNQAGLNGGGIYCDKPTRDTDIVLNEGWAYMNFAVNGGFLHVISCSLSVVVYNFLYNEATYGGAIYANKSRVFRNYFPQVSLTNNTAKVDGGAIYTVNSFIVINNLGQLIFSQNTVTSPSGRGGAIYIKDSNCESIQEIEGHCSIDVRDLTDVPVKHFSFYNNNAPFGSALYGGLLDRCYNGYSDVLGITYFKQASLYDEKIPMAITSHPVKICFCQGVYKPDCIIRNHVVSKMRGDSVKVSVTAVDQDRNPVPAIIRATYGVTTAVLGEGEGRIQFNGSCRTVAYHIFTADTSATLILHPEGVCERSSLSFVAINFKIVSCSQGFELNKDRCVCDGRLVRYLNITTCFIDTQSVQRKQSIWFKYQNDHLMMAANCPMDYCQVTPDTISLIFPDKECANRRSGVLCGACQLNYSITLGGSKCLPCTNRYAFIWLIVIFALAGIFLVALLLVCNMTISQGTLNGLIFYANVIAISGLTNVQNCSIHPVLSVFIAWVNLDLGIETCFYPGMNTYQKIWLQFAFPLYIILLVIAILVVSYYSTTAMKVFGRNNMAILATLFLFSYSKALKTIIATFSATQMLMSDANNVSAPVLPHRVWSYDGNIDYLKGKHVVLFVVALGFLLFLFLPYTLLLTFGQFLRTMRLRRRWILKFMHSTAFISIMDAYHAPYSRKHRYWIGLMLLTRCVLFIAFSMVYTGDKITVNSYMIVLVISGILLIKTCSMTHYKSFWKNALELSFLYNLVVLGATVYFLKSNSLKNMTNIMCNSINASILISYVVFLGILLYHAHLKVQNVRLYQMAKQAFQRKFPSKNMTDFSNKNEKESSRLILPTKSVVELREELLASNNN